MNRGTLVVISGFAGSGKSSLVKELLGKYDNYRLSVSATTRAPRPGEEHGREYFFVSRSEFLRMIDEDAFLEHAEYVGNCYGTPRKSVEAFLEQGFDVILEIETQGAMKIREKMPETALIFVTPPSAAELERRLVSRGTETAEVIENRMRRAAEESREMEQYDYVVINDDLHRCAEEIHGIIQAQHSRSGSRLDLIHKIQDDLQRRN